MSIPIRVGCVPYLNAKPLIEYFEWSLHPDVELIYATPSKLARMLEDGELDVALVSIFEWFLHQELVVIPGCSISADGPVKSVRLFSNVEFEVIKSVALDISSLTSSALTRVLLNRVFGITPDFRDMPPDVDQMLKHADAGLIIGDLRDFNHLTGPFLDLGDCWKNWTGTPFCYAAWLARPNCPLNQITDILNEARIWGEARRTEIALKWANKFEISEAKALDYIVNVMKYDLGPDKIAAVSRFQEECRLLGLLDSSNIGSSRG